MQNIQDILGRSFEVGDFKISIYNFILAMGIVLLGWFINRVVQKQLLKRIWKKRGDVKASVRFTTTIIIRYVIILFTVILAVNAMGLQISILFAGLAALLFGLGIGIQNLFNDIVSGFILLFDDSVNIGDVLQVEDLTGEVLEINLRTTKLRTNERIVFIVPNSKLTTNRIINYTQQSPISNFTVKVGVAYGSDTEKVRDILLHVAANTEGVLKWPEPRVRLDNFGDSSLDFTLFFASKHSLDIEFIRSDLRFAISKAFSRNNVRIPFPQRDLHIKPSPGTIISDKPSET